MQTAESLLGEERVWVFTQKEREKGGRASFVSHRQELGVEVRVVVRQWRDSQQAMGGLPTSFQPLTDHPCANSVLLTIPHTVALFVGICTVLMEVCMSGGAMGGTAQSCLR